MRRPGDWLTLGIAVALLGLLGVATWQADRRADGFVGDLTDARERQAELAEGIATLEGQVEALGGDPAVEVEQTPEGPEPVEQPGPQGERGETGPAPSDAEIAEPVERYCAEHGCTGPQGPAPSPTQVAAAVANYCDARGQCQGPSGPAGSVGPAGATGPQGEPGPGPSDEQIAAAVEAYCVEHGCRGPAGADGAQGPQGPAGEPGPACPAGAEPRTWTVDQAASVIIGLEPGTYVICRGGE